MASSHSLIDRLQHRTAFPHKVDGIELRETHISWILLTGMYAYKIKKPVNLGFLDFSTLAQRHRYCQEEIRLNRRFAPELYLDVVAITGTPDSPRIGGEGLIIEYAVRMRQFSEELLFSRLITAGELAPERIDELAQVVGRFHAEANHLVPAADYGSPAEIRREALDNLRELQDLPGTSEELARLATWTEAEFQRLGSTFQHRRDCGSVRECHGDLHLRNLVIVNDRVTMFDGIEFNDAFRWIDVLSDASFVAMDLADQRRSDLSFRFIDRYLAETGDYGGLQVLPWYLVYRSLVRAKVARIRASQEGAHTAENVLGISQAQEYVRLAEKYTHNRRPAIVITHGVSGSGKTTGTHRLVESIGAVRIRSDVERKRMAGLPSQASSGSTINQGLYDARSTAATYDRLQFLARQIVFAGFPVIVDATFLKREQRTAFRQLATELQVPLYLLPFKAPHQELAERIQRRQSVAGEASEATLDVLEQQLKTCDPLTDDEQRSCRTLEELEHAWNS